MTGQPDDPKNPSSNPEQNYSASQLRMARRKARRLGLNPANGVQAIQMLQERGIEIDEQEPNLTDNAAAAPNAPNAAGGDPKAAAAAAQAAAAGKKAGGPKAPVPQNNNALLADKNQNQIVPASNVIGANAPAVITKEQRELEIAKLENRIKKRRESKMRKLIRRFSLFVILPSLLMGIYYYIIATPLYVANTELMLEQASSASTGGIPGLLQGTAFGSPKEAIAVESYMESREAFTRLEADYPFIALFQGDKVDRFLRVPEDASLEERYKTFGKQVKVTYDSTDQMLRMEVRTPDPVSATEISELLLGYAETRVDEQTQRVRDTGVKDAEILVAEKLDALQAAQEDIFTIQEMQNTLDPTADKEALVAQIQELKAQLIQAELVLQQLTANSSPNAIRVRAQRAQIQLLEETIAGLTEEGTDIDDQGQSIARVDQQMQIAQTKLALLNREYEAASLNLQNAEAEARSQRRFITTSLPPTASFAPIYPKKLLMTFSAFMIFFAIYILVSITIEVIREQVSA